VNLGDWDEGSPVPFYVISGSGSPPETTKFDLVTLVTSRSTPVPGMQPEHTRILLMCDNPLSVAEISHYMELPFSVVTALLSTLASEEHIETTAPAPVTSLPQRRLLEDVIHGLQRLTF
jgi:hypothetical protein